MTKICKECQNIGFVIIRKPYVNGKCVDESRNCHCSYGKIHEMRKQAYTRDSMRILRHLMGRQ